MKTVVVYKSKTGFTKKYADWLAREFSCDLFMKKKISVDTLMKYETIIYGGGIYAIEINGLSIIKKNYAQLKKKNLIVFAVGTILPRENELEEIWKKNLSSEQISNIKLFYFIGGFNYNKLGNGDKLLITLMKRSLKLNKNSDEDTLTMLEAYNTPTDLTDINDIKPLVDYLKSIS